MNESVVVPVEPTEEMIDAGYRVIMTNHSVPASVEIAYRAMIEAAPTPEQSEGKSFWVDISDEADAEADRISRELHSEITPMVKQSEVERLQAENEALRVCLEELRAIVIGEAPSLLDEDRGGSGKLALDIEALLEQTK